MPLGPDEWVVGRHTPLAVLTDPEIGDDSVRRYLDPIRLLDHRGAKTETLRTYLATGRRVERTVAGRSQLIVRRM
jgi:hypothetical protein